MKDDKDALDMSLSSGGTRMINNFAKVSNIDVSNIGPGLGVLDTHVQEEMVDVQGNKEKMTAENDLVDASLGLDMKGKKQDEDSELYDFEYCFQSEDDVGAIDDQDMPTPDTEPQVRFKGDGNISEVEVQSDYGVSKDL